MEEQTFETSFDRLEKILEEMNSKTISLEDSLKLFEEADQLIVKCSKRLTNAEQKIEQLLKNRAKELNLTEDQKPKTEPFMPRQGAETGWEEPF